MHPKVHVPIRLTSITALLFFFLGWFPAKSISSPHPTPNTTEQQICPFEINFTVNGLTVTATLVSSNPAAPPATVKWFLGGGQFIGTGPQITHTFPIAGTYEICAQYEFDNQICTTCKNISIITGPCIDTSLIDLSIACPAIYDPVCGCDGNTYANACEALNHHGVTFWIPGACSGAPPCIGLIAGFNSMPIINNPSTFQFHDLSSIAIGQIVQWEWDFGDGTTASIQNPLHTYSAPGNYAVCLTVTAVSSSGGSPCTDIHCENITITNGCVDHCGFTVGFQLTGLHLFANLQPPVIDALLPDSVVWTLNGQVIEHGPELNINLPEPGKYILCAKYITVDGFHCEACAVVNAKIECINESVINPAQACPSIVDPVCGCDGETYSNACEALYHHGIMSWHKGQCNSVGICNGLIVGFEGANTGGSLTLWSFNSHVVFPATASYAYHWDFGNGQSSTLENPNFNFQVPGEYVVCLTVTATTPNGASCAATTCQVFKVGFNCIDPGLINLNIQCPAIYAPVCGCDGVTYENECVAQFHNGVSSWTNGPCANTCIDPECIDTTVFCTTIYDPVCGCDGITYSNDCIAVYGHGITSWKKGACCSVSCDSLIVKFNWTVDPTDSLKLFFNDLSLFPGGQFTDFFWSFGDGTTSIDQNPDHHYTEKGEYVVCLKIKATLSNGETCTKEICKTIKVGFECENACHFDIQVAQNGTQVHTWLQSNPVNPQLPGTIKWFVEGNFVSTGPQFFYTFAEPGRYTICAAYEGLNGDNCTVCKTIAVENQLCIDSALIDPNVICTTIYEPVCGCDGITYPNKCEAESHHGITSWTPGVCPDACINPAWADSTALCPQFYDPVCGCDGVTYSNSCVALNNFGVTSWKKGPCCNSQECKAFFKFEILPDNTIVISDLSVNAESWSLNLGDGTLHSGYFNTLTHTYAQAGIYEICLEISNLAGTCTDKYCVVIDFSTNSTHSPNNTITLQMAPNPASQFTRVTVGGATPVTSTLFDSFGQIVWSAASPGLFFEVPLRGLPDGLYMLVVQTEKGAVVRKLVVNK